MKICLSGSQRESRCSISITSTLKPPAHAADHVSELINEGAPDTDVVRLAKKRKAVVVSQDDDYQTVAATFALVRKLRVGYVLFKAPRKSGNTYEDIVRSLVTAWPELRNALQHEKPPFMVTIDRNGQVIRNDRFRR